MERYFAYGSNLSTEQMQVRCPTARALSPCTLEGWRFTFVQPHDGWGVAALQALCGQRSQSCTVSFTNCLILTCEARPHRARGGR